MPPAPPAQNPEAAFCRAEVTLVLVLLGTAGLVRWRSSDALEALATRTALLVLDQDLRKAQMAAFAGRRTVLVTRTGLAFALFKAGRGWIRLV
jgi:hypothetical protein